MKTIYQIDSSARVVGSFGRLIGDELVYHLQALLNAGWMYRDVSQGLEFLTPAALSGLYIPRDQQTPEQAEALYLSDQIVDEIKAADYIVISAPLYNFGPSASLKAWADLVARKDLTFTYTAQGPQGLLQGKKAFVVFTSGGVPMGAPVDHLTPWLKDFLAFIGITDVTFLAADQLAINESESISKVSTQIKSIRV